MRIVKTVRNKGFALASLVTFIKIILLEPKYSRVLAVISDIGNTSVIVYHSVREHPSNKLKEVTPHKGANFPSTPDSQIQPVHR